MRSKVSEVLAVNMLCPSCGIATQPDQKFCRSCGASLQMTTQPLADPSHDIELVSPSAIDFRTQEQRRNSLVLRGFAIMLIGAAIGVIGKMLLHQDIVKVVGVLISLAGMFIVVYPYLSALRPKKSDSSPQSRPEALPLSQSLKNMPHESTTEYVPSITERTTDLLKNSVTIKAGPTDDSSNNPHSDSREKP